MTGNVDTKNPAEIASSVIFLPFLPLTVISLATRYRRGDLTERLQIRWMGLAVALLLASAGLQNILADFSNPVGIASNAVAFVAFPVAVGLAIIRYRLYDIDRVISRTVAYAIVIGMVAAIYLAGVALLTQILPAESDIAVAGSTLAAAAVFYPLRRRVGSWVDRKFNRTRYQSDQVLAELASRLRVRPELASIRPQVETVIATSLQPSTLHIWMREPTDPARNRMASTDIPILLIDQCSSRRFMQMGSLKPSRRRSLLE